MTARTVQCVHVDRSKAVRNMFYNLAKVQSNMPALVFSSRDAPLFQRVNSNPPRHTLFFFCPRERIVVGTEDKRKQNSEMIFLFGKFCVSFVLSAVGMFRMRDVTKSGRFSKYLMFV